MRKYHAVLPSVTENTNIDDYIKQCESHLTDRLGLSVSRIDAILDVDVIFLFYVDHDVTESMNEVFEWCRANGRKIQIARICGITEDCCECKSCSYYCDVCASWYPKDEPCIFH